MWSFIKSVVKTVVKLATGVVWWCWGALGSIFLFWMEKKMRVHINILHDASEPALVTLAEAEAAVQRAAAIIQHQFNTKLVHYGNPYIEIIKEPAPARVLDIKHTTTNFLSREVDDFVAAHQVGWNALPITAVHPVTIFVVHSIKHGSETWNGFFVGGFTDSIFITPSGVRDDTTLAHEMGHCMLLHRKKKANLMHHEHPRGTSITSWQKWWFRTSRNVNFW